MQKNSLRITISVILMSFFIFLSTGIPSFGEETKDEEKKEEKWDVSNPPGEWKSITIDTEETTWTNLDVSPDGKTIVFDMLGDLYTIPIDGGEAAALTNGIEWNFQPRYSPDGSRIAFVSDRSGADNIWVMNADGSNPKAITKEEEHLVQNPNWSPDGMYIAGRKGFTSTRSIPAGEIWLFHAGGGDGLQVIKRPYDDKDQKNIAEPAFSPDGRYLYFSQDVTDGRVWQYNKDSTGSLFAIQRLDRETGKVETFVSGPGGAVRPTPSPDGKKLAFVKRLPGLVSALYVKDINSGKEIAIYDQFERDNQETSGSEGNAPAFQWMPDSKSIVFWSSGKLHRVDADTREHKMIPVHVKVEKKIQAALRFPVDVAPDSFAIRMLRWTQMSPDGSKILFQALGHLYIKDVKSGKQQRLTGQNTHFEFYPSFSRDGKWIVYTTWNDTDLGSVRIASADGKQNRTLTKSPGHYLEPRFSPDGSRIVFRKMEGGYLLSPLWSMEPGIYIVSTSGGDPKRILDSGFAPHFGSQNDRIFFSDNEEETKLVLKSVNLDGYDERTHFSGANATEFSVSPDGQWIAFTENYNAYVAPFALTGKKVDISSSMKSIPVKQVSKRAGEFLHWSARSDKLYWSNASTLYSRDLKDAFDFLKGSPEKLPEPVESGVNLSFEVPLNKPSGKIALKGARIVTMRDARNAQEVIEDGVVLVEGNRISAVGPADQVAIPEGTQAFDVTGKTIIPGLVDVHAHGGQEMNEVTPQQNWMQYSNLSFGVTTIHDPSNDTSGIFSAAELQKAGDIVAPRIFSTGTILYGAHAPGYTAEVHSLEDAKFHIQRLKDAGAISVKSYNQPGRNQRQQILAAARELGMMVVPEGGMRFQHNMTMLVDGHTGIEHAIHIKTAYDDVLQLWSQTEVGYTPTLGVAYGGLSGELYWYDRTNVWENERLMRYVPRSIVEPRAIRRPKAPDDHYNHIFVAKTAKNLSDRGVSVQIGAHGQREGLAAHWELWMLQQGGFTPWEALRSGTINGARYIGLDRDIGSIEKGKLADLVVIDGNPLEDLRRSEYVVYTMINGRLYEAATMNQIAPEKKERQKFYFELEGGDTIHAGALEWLRSFQGEHGCPHDLP